ncbi:MAG: hypothetical protein GX030_02895 [Firmicutes bacterium]|nr:hypothetical protein [Bacillota bacterium]
MRKRRFMILSLAVVLVLGTVGIAVAANLDEAKTRVQLILEPYAEVAFGSTGLLLRASIPEGGRGSTGLVIKTNTQLDVTISSGGFGTAASDNDEVDPFVKYELTRSGHDWSIGFGAGEASSFVTPTDYHPNGKYGNGLFDYELQAEFDAANADEDWWKFTSDLHYFDDIVITVTKKAD